ncbi:MAG: xanthine dehydrogenase family protein subunit M [Nitrososphaerota archaeon]|nr:xanthine dehydrogenase family protein subunit M [Nitrososphaerota archaeon]MDG7023604.1 xanthine dehydrogenase family protein subunit M [Nitrososphaerota archaeon]
MSFGSPYVSLPDFTYHSPKTLDETIALLKEHGDQAKLMGGGVGLLAFMKERLMSPAHVIDVKGVTELKRVERVPGKGLAVGAGVSIAELLEGRWLDGYSVLREALEKVADPMIRRRATLVGNLCEAIPWVDSPPVLIALDTTVEIVGPNGKRSVPVSGFIRGPVDIDLNPEEIVTGVAIPDARGTASAFEKFTGGSEFSLASVAVALSGEGRKRSAKVVYGAVNSTPVRCPEAEEALADGVTPASIRKAAEVASEKVECVDDVLATAAYRRHLVRVITIRVLRRMLRA